jgi:hypothetical protein
LGALTSKGSNSGLLMRERERTSRHKPGFHMKFYQGYHREAHKPNFGHCKPAQNLNNLFITDYQNIYIYIYIYIKQQKHKTVGQLAKLDQRKCKTNLHSHNPLRAV